MHTFGEMKKKQFFTSLALLVFKKKTNYLFFSFQILIPVPTHLLPFLPPTSPSHPIHSSEMVRHITLSKDQGRPHCIWAEQGIPPKRMGSKKPVQAGGINPGATASGPAVCPSHTTVTRIQRI